MPSNVTIKIKNDILKRVTEQLKNALPFYQFLGARMKQESDERFMKQVDPTGAPWQKDSELTLRCKTTPFTMIDSSDLMKSVKSNASSKGLLFGTNKVYANIHQHGGTIRAKKWLWIPLHYKAKRALQLGTLDMKKMGLVKVMTKGKWIVIKPFVQKIGGAYARVKGAAKATKHRGFEIWYSLKKSVKIPRRTFIGAPSQKTVIDSLKEWLGL